MPALDFTHLATPAEAGVDPAGIARMEAALEGLPLTEPHALVVARHGQVIRRRGWGPYDPGEPQLLYSLSKSFASTGLGIAVDEGLVGLDDYVLDYFPEVVDDRIDERTRRMKVRHIAAMASGHATGMWPLLRSTDPTELFHAFFHLPPDAEPGTLFAYNQMCTYSFAEIVRRQSGEKRFLDYLRPRLFEPLGAEAAGWQQFCPGLDLAFTGLFASCDTVAKLGQLYLDKGMWGDRRIVSEAWVADATSYHSDNSPWGTEADLDWHQGYGYQFWLCRHGFRGDGAFGQFCIVVPDHDLVVALTSQTGLMQQILDAVWDNLLPACDDALIPSDRFASTAVKTQVHGGMETDFTPLQWVALTLEGSRFTLSDGTRSLVANAGSGDWTRTPRGVDTPVAVAAKAAWTDAQVVLEIAFTETPHTLVLTGDRATGATVADWYTPPLIGDTLLDLGYPG
jgi:CubicO group peptidase (beta-lactamase class C family)